MTSSFTGYTWLAQAGEAVESLSERDMERFLHLFDGRENTYSIIDVMNGKKTSTTMPEMLGIEIIRRHLAGEQSVAAFVQRSNASLK